MSRTVLSRARNGRPQSDLPSDLRRLLIFPASLPWAQQIPPIGGSSPRPTASISSSSRGRPLPPGSGVFRVDTIFPKMGWSPKTTRSPTRGKTMPDSGQVTIRARSSTKACRQEGSRSASPTTSIGSASVSPVWNGVAATDEASRN